MPTSDFTFNGDKLVRMAFKRVGKDYPATNEVNDGWDILNIVLKHLDKEGRFFWATTNTESTLTLVAGQTAYDAGSGATNVARDIVALSAVAIYRNANDREYLRIVDKWESLTTDEKDAGRSDPYLCYLERAPLSTSQKVHFYPAPASALTIKYTYRRRLYDFDLLSDLPDFPQEHVLPLVKILASELATHVGLPLPERQLFQSEAMMAKRDMKMFNADEVNDSPVAQSEYF